LFGSAFLVNGPEVQYVVKRQAARAIGDEYCRFVGQQWIVIHVFSMTQRDDRHCRKTLADLNPAR
jgi:hypothetical protein